MIDCTQVDTLFGSFNQEEVERYQDYWDSVQPKTESDVFNRYLFAFMSVHTTWENNVRGYEAVKDWTQWINLDDKLEQLLVESRVGLHKGRTRYLSEFATKFWQDPQRYMYQGGNWQDWRNDLVEDILGLGMAKVSFSLEMIYPNKAMVTCMDTHLFQAYGLNQNKHSKQYKNIEDYWLFKSRESGVPPYIARCILWDRKQEQPDSRYWSYVLED